MEGIEYFKSLDTLICRGVNPEVGEYDYDGSPGRLRSLDLSANIWLRHLECDGNALQTLVLPDNPSLEFLRCSHNKLTTIDLSINAFSSITNKLPRISEIRGLWFMAAEFADWV